MTPAPRIPAVGCHYCHGTGWREHPAQSGVMPCDQCERGRRVRELRRERFAVRSKRRGKPA